MAGLSEVASAIIDRLRALAGQLVAAASKQDAREVVAVASQMESYAELLELSWPTPEPGADLANLQRHIDFSIRHGAKGKWTEMSRDPTDCLADLAGLSSQLALVAGRIRPGLRARVEGLPGGPDRDYALEALASLGAGACRAAITTAGAAMETRARRTYESVVGQPSGGLKFYEVIDELEARDANGAIRQIDIPALGILRVYRNLTAHPTDFPNPDSVAPALVELACEIMLGQPNVAQQVPAAPAPPQTSGAQAH
jgi:hypothetical protein